jgi:hypothetical protein
MNTIDQFVLAISLLSAITEETPVSQMKAALKATAHLHTADAPYEVFASFYEEVERIDVLVYGVSED